jgi:hypothetical protein
VEIIAVNSEVTEDSKGLIEVSTVADILDKFGNKNLLIDEAFFRDSVDVPVKSALHTEIRVLTRTEAKSDLDPFLPKFRIIQVNSGVDVESILSEAAKSAATRVNDNKST